MACVRPTKIGNATMTANKQPSDLQKQYIHRIIYTAINRPTCILSPTKWNAEVEKRFRIIKTLFQKKKQKNDRRFDNGIIQAFLTKPHRHASISFFKQAFVPILPIAIEERRCTHASYHPIHCVIWCRRFEDCSRAYTECVCRSSCSFRNHTELYVFQLKVIYIFIILVLFCLFTYVHAVCRMRSSLIFPPFFFHSIRCRTKIIHTFFSFFSTNVEDGRVGVASGIPGMNFRMRLLCDIFYLLLFYAINNHTNKCYTRTCTMRAFSRLLSHARTPSPPHGSPISVYC